VKERDARKTDTVRSRTRAAAQPPASVRVSGHPLDGKRSCRAGLGERSRGCDRGLDGRSCAVILRARRRVRFTRRAHAPRRPSTDNRGTTIVIICSCNVLSDQDVRTAMATSVPPRTTGARVQSGISWTSPPASLSLQARLVPRRSQTDKRASSAAAILRMMLRLPPPGSTTAVPIANGACGAGYERARLKPATVPERSVVLTVKTRHPAALPEPPRGLETDQFGTGNYILAARGVPRNAPSDLLAI
jgi:hypothetical protein